MYEEETERIRGGYGGNKRKKKLFRLQVTFSVQFKKFGNKEIIAGKAFF